MRFDRCLARKGLPERWTASGDRVTAMVVPSAGMNLVSLCIDGEDRLVLPVPLSEFMLQPRTGGVPLLHPWANRLRGDRYEAVGRRVDLSGIPDLKRDGHDLPMHGLLLRATDWVVETVDSIEDGSAVIEGSIDWKENRQGFEAFPFPHRVAVRWTLKESGGADASARCDLVIEPRGTAVPVGSGWHPYLRPLAGVDRGDLELRLPPVRRVRLDQEGLPLIDAAGSPRLEGPLDLNGVMGDRVMDDLYRAPDGGWSGAVIAGGRRVEIETDDSWPWLQVYAPTGSDFICIEPMLAPTAALSDGHAVLVEPGAPLEASFTIRILEEGGD